MELNDEAKDAVKELGSAINNAIERAPQVAEAIDRLRELGFLAQLTLRLEIGLQDLSELSDDEEPVHIEKTEFGLELTEDDLRTLRQMKIKIDPEDE